MCTYVESRNYTKIPDFLTLSSAQYTTIIKLNPRLLVVIVTKQDAESTIIDIPVCNLNFC